MKSTFTTRIFRSILPWMAVLFLLASWLFFYYQAKVFVEEKTEDMEVLIADRAHDFDERFNVIGYVQGNLNYEKVTGMLKSTLKGRREAESVFGAITRDGEIVFAEDADSTNAKAAEVILQNASSGSGRFEIRKPERQTVIYQKLNATGWIFFAKISNRILLQPIQREALVLIFLVLPMSILLMTLVIKLLARRIQRPMERLKNRVEHVDIENYEPDRAEYEIREVQIVADRFEESMERNKRRVNQYPARLKGGSQSSTEINAQLHNAPSEHCFACLGMRRCAGIRFEGEDDHNEAAIHRTITTVHRHFILNQEEGV